MGKILTNSGGSIETFCKKDIINGSKCMIIVDQSTSTSDDEAKVSLCNNEVKDLIALLNDYIVFTEGKPFVVLAEPLLHPDVKIVVNNDEIKKEPSLLNQYLNIDDILTPGESIIDKSNYFNNFK